MDTNWVIAGQPDNAIPVIGQEYEIRDRRKGTFCGKILNVHGEFADVEVTEGSPKFRSLDFKLQYSGYVSIRAGLVYLIELEPANTACTPTKGVAPSNEDVQQPELFTAKPADSSPTLRG